MMRGGLGTYASTLRFTPTYQLHRGGARKMADVNSDIQIERQQYIAGNDHFFRDRRPAF